MADLSLNCYAMVDRVLVFQQITVASASADDRTDALARLNDGYDRVTRGDYITEDGIAHSHAWSWLKPWTTIAITADDSNYDLVAGYGGMGQLIHSFVDGESFAEILRKSPEAIKRSWRDTDDTDEPTGFSVVAKTFTSTTGQRWELHLAKMPDADRTLNIRFRALPDALTDDNTKYPMGGPETHRMIVQGAKAEYERIAGQVAGPEEARFQLDMLSAVRRDKTFFSEEDEIQQLTDIDVGCDV